MPVTDCVIAEDVVITHPELVNLYGYRIDAGTRIGPLVELQRGGGIGARCKISSARGSSSRTRCSWGIA